MKLMFNCGSFNLPFGDTYINFQYKSNTKRAEFIFQLCWYTIVLFTSNEIICIIYTQEKVCVGRLFVVCVCVMNISFHNLHILLLKRKCVPSSYCQDTFTCCVYIFDCITHLPYVSVKGSAYSCKVEESLRNYANPLYVSFTTENIPKTL